MHPLHAPVLRLRQAMRPTALAVLALAAGARVHAQADLPALQLESSPQLREGIPGPQRSQLPTFIEGNRISGRSELDTVVEGQAMLRRGDMVIRADRLEYLQPDDLARASGHVRINRAGDVYEGPLLEMKVEAFEGFFNEPRYRFLRNGAYGQASRVEFLDPDHAVIHQATYTTCAREPDGSWPAWILTADRLQLDNAQDTGVATGASLRFYGVPILPMPSLSFPLSDKRKSGLLPPLWGVDSRSGMTFVQPYYWNIAPNRDATLTPTYISKRGMDLGGEFRYLEPDYRGTLRASYLPGDTMLQRDRWSYSLQHNDQLLRTPLPRGVNWSLNLNRVSDDDYWRDFPRKFPSLTQRLLPNEGLLSWGQGKLSLQARALQWQTLQDTSNASAAIIPPYDRLPQLVARYTDTQLPLGLNTLVETDFTRFRSVRDLTGQANADRSYLLTQVSRPWQAPGWFVVPKAQLHARQYHFDTPLASTGLQAAQVTVPTFSLDSGLVFEREASLLGRSLVQTLEPRAFYVYTPFRDQNFLPNYDSGLNDFNFATIYSDNSFGGNDRIADNKLLTLGVTSRLQEADTGAQLARFGIAQRLRYAAQRVVLNPTTDPVVPEGVSDVLLGGSVNWTRAWSTDATVQYNPKLSQSERSTIGARYNPSDYRVLSAAYRRQRGLSEQIDVGWQWPLNDLWGDRGQDLGPGRGQGGGRWYSVGRINTSLKDRRIVDMVTGVEYDGCCWIGRVVLERLQSGTAIANTRLLFQLEFVGFVRLGTNALGALKDNIPRYQFLRDQVAPPSRFTQYE